MLLTITYASPPATDLGFLLHKNPSRRHTLDLSFGRAHVFYPEATDERCTAAVLLDVDPIALVRGKPGKGGDGALDQYVNDRPYVASSFMSVALARAFATAFTGRSKERPELAQTPLPLEARIAVLPCRGGEAFLRRLFEPLGYVVEAEPHVLDPTFPDWGTSDYFTVRLQGIVRLQDLLAHLYVLIPVLDDLKHYWVGEDEIEKLLRRGEGWLATHPEREQITFRYLRRVRPLTREALSRLADDQRDPDREEVAHDREEAAVERELSLNEQRMDAVMAALKETGARRVIDLGCGEGTLLRRLALDPRFEAITGVDVSVRVLEAARERLDREPMPSHMRDRVTLLHGSLMYRDSRFAGYDAAALTEVIEHMDPPRLAAFERVVFEFAKPASVVITTPNADYNPLFPALPAGRFRHKDHRFEWGRSKCEKWSLDVARRYGYQVHFRPVGPVDPSVGAPTQMALFTRDSER